MYSENSETLHKGRLHKPCILWTGGIQRKDVDIKATHFTMTACVYTCARLTHYMDWSTEIAISPEGDGMWVYLHIQILVRNSFHRNSRGLPRRNFRESFDRNTSGTNMCRNIPRIISQKCTANYSIAICMLQPARVCAYTRIAISPEGETMSEIRGVENEQSTERMEMEVEK